MPKPLDPELRRRVVDTVLGGATLDEAAVIHSVGRASVNRWTSRFKKTGSVDPKPTGGPRNVKLTEESIRFLLDFVKAHPDATLARLVDELEKSCHVKIGKSAVAEALKKRGLSRKKKSLVATEQKSERVMLLRSQFAGKQKQHDPERLVFIDEAGTHISMTPTHGWAPRGERLHDYVPRNRGTVTTMLGALTIGGLEAVMTIEGSTNSAVFHAFITEVVAPRLNAGDIVILDNVSAHKNKKTKQHLEKMGVELVFLPPYSPDMNPIEECWSKVKSALRRFCARTIEGLDSAIASAAEAVTPTDAAGWFAHAGYRV